MTETGSTVVERINAELNYDGVSHWEDICVKSADVRALLAVVEELEALVAALEVDGCLDAPEDLDDAKEALAALHSQASDDLSQNERESTLPSESEN